MGILGVLAAAVMPLGEALVTSQKERELRRALWEIRDAVDAYKRHVDQGLIDARLTESGYPASLRTLVEGVPDARAASGGQRWYFLRQVPRDPFADANLSPEQTWRLRSYASPPDRPAPGADVYDVRSSSTGTALDGSAYANW
ncbi:MAG: general secretion pathway protein GspG [Hydrogenophaga sp.]|nr:general secretion pathway protein GspG [Hydrogenophaga sp.]NIN25999.1 general secretion pathway protein GspG [Hydrogenophaga sp.]NIN30871.1 general secretion pathway protein GspG [Hydrogenophaga sp.]NIN54964.1 general secretion pathway protein GspG [Hydrogenophaga sp.]NIO51004.1 general secretion pathway protein GspG [Hydrogenophaga sp.]